MTWILLTLVVWYNPTADVYFTTEREHEMTQEQCVRLSGYAGEDWLLKDLLQKVYKTQWKAIPVKVEATCIKRLDT